ncbi:class I SAM-dependent methyltransferase [Lacihabitans sp. LS3-19]|uniref:class I SAM-dependent methyltransferase n=1 Tax=Lacihabitans sp. LS3-19 TaxID=2487335 RepID=UPI0020CD4212|nr:class I SAM-dependent methyltransferase [Lacihabitans sp. LS3-19]MCP9770568.1 class I SAM-dependent methyltransferase [Lacihabitans sp. LS3-19]
MENFDSKNHWETIYKTKELNTVSWYQPIPQTSLDFIEEADLPKDAHIIDIGGGDSFLVDHLLNLGYLNVTVLDISEVAIEKAKERLGERAEKVNWIIADINDFKTGQKYDLWHDRAAFHFLQGDIEIENYIKKANQLIVKNGTLVIGTFSENGPLKCSGIEIKRYSTLNLTEKFKEYFDINHCETFDHITPSAAVQNFSFCSFKKKE